MNTDLLNRYDTATGKLMQQLSSLNEEQLNAVHSQIFFNALDGITEEMALERNNGKTNHVVWMTGNFINCRYWLADLMGQIGLMRKLLGLNGMSCEMNKKIDY